MIGGYSPEGRFVFECCWSDRDCFMGFCFVSEGRAANTSDSVNAQCCLSILAHMPKLPVTSLIQVALRLCLCYLTETKYHARVAKLPSQYVLTACPVLEEDPDLLLFSGLETHLKQQSQFQHSSSLFVFICWCTFSLLKIICFMFERHNFANNIPKIHPMLAVVELTYNSNI